MIPNKYRGVSFGKTQQISSVHKLRGGGGDLRGELKIFYTEKGGGG